MCTVTWLFFFILLERAKVVTSYKAGNICTCVKEIVALFVMVYCYYYYYQLDV